MYGAIFRCSFFCLWYDPGISYKHYNLASSQLLPMLHFWLTVQPGKSLPFTIVVMLPFRECVVAHTPPFSSWSQGRWWLHLFHGYVNWQTPSQQLNFATSTSSVILTWPVTLSDHVLLCAVVLIKHTEIGRCPPVILHSALAFAQRSLPYPSLFTVPPTQLLHRVAGMSCDIVCERVSFALCLQDFHSQEIIVYKLPASS